MPTLILVRKDCYCTDKALLDLDGLEAEAATTTPSKRLLLLFSYLGRYLDRGWAKIRKKVQFKKAAMFATNTVYLKMF